MQAYPLYPVDVIEDLRQLVERRGRLTPEWTAFVTREDRKISYGELADGISRLGNALIARGLGGERVAVMGENCYQWIVAYLAVVNTGGTIVPLDKELGEGEIREILRRTGAKGIFFTQGYRAEALQAGADNCKLFVELDGEGGEGTISLPHLLEEGEAARRGKDAYQGAVLNREVPAVILFTSGTTGRSKGVMLSHANLAANIVSACQMVGFVPGDVLLSVLPIHHTYECTCGILCMLHYGVTICFNESIKRLPHNLKKYRPTAMFLVPLYVETFHKRIWEQAEKTGAAGKLRFAIGLTNALDKVGIHLKRKLLQSVHDFFGGRLEKIICGGAYMDPRLGQAYRDLGIHLFQGYGITECSPLVAVNRNDYYKDAAAGIPVPGCQVRIAHPEEGIGEVQVMGRQVMLGYFGEPGLTAEVFQQDWFRTGDMGYMDGEGFLYITGRHANMVALNNGKNVYPEELEPLLTADPLVAEAVITGGGENGIEYLVALIHPDPQQAQALGAEAVARRISDLVASVNEGLVPHKRIRHHELREEPFPKTTSRKIMRYQIGGE